MYSLLWGIYNGIFIKQEVVLTVLVSLGLAICCVFFVQCKRNKSSSYIITWGDVGIAVFFLVSILNLLLTNGSHSNTFLIYQWIALLFAYILIRCIENKKVVLNVIVLSGIIQGIIAIVQWVGFMESNHHVFEVTGSFGNPGQLGGYQSITLVVSLCMLSYESKKAKLTRGILSIASFLILFSVYLADSRASIVALTFGLVFFYSIPIKKCIRKHFAASVLAIILFVVGIGFLLFKYREGSANARLLIWRVSSDMICEKPIFGHGIAAFSKEYMLYQAQYFEQYPSSDFVEVADNVAYPYNELLHILIEQGLTGGIVVIILLILFLAYTPRAHIQRTAKAGLATLVTFSMFSYPAYVFPLLLLFPVLMGMSGSFPMKRFPMNSWILAGCLLLVLPISVRSVIEISLYNKSSRTVRQLFDTPHASHTLFIDEHYSKLIYSDSFIGLYTAYLSKIHDIERMLKLPPSSELFCEIGNAFAEKGDADKAKKYYKLAANMIPTRVLPNYLLWKLEVQNNNREDAVNIAKTIISQPTKVENTFTIRVRAEMRKFLESNQ